MTIAPEKPLITLPDEPPSRPSWQGVADKWRDPAGLKRLAVTLGAYVACLALFGLFVLTQSKDPFSVYNSIIHSAFLSSGSIAEVLLRAVPIVLAALAGLDRVRRTGWLC